MSGSNAMLTLLSLTLGFWAQSLRLQSGLQISLHGQGPPVLFSSGLYGLMPRRIYSRLFSELSKNLTMVVLDSVAPVRADLLDDICSTIRSDDIGLFAHSSLDMELLRSDRVRSAVLCDPVVYPSVQFLPHPGVTSPLVARDIPMLILKAEQTYSVTSGGTAFPDFLIPTGPSDTSERVFDKMGHADLLDDTWAELAPRVFPFMASASAPSVPFDGWTRKALSSSDATAIRRSYRRSVAALSSAHFQRKASDSPVSELVPDDVLVDL